MRYRMRDTGSERPDLNDRKNFPEKTAAGYFPIAAVPIPIFQDSTFFPVSGNPAAPRIVFPHRRPCQGMGIAALSLYPFRQTFLGKMANL
jgi:hypothetical protein